MGRFAVQILITTFTWMSVAGNCDLSQCPIVCAGAPCSSSGSFSLDPTGPPTSCQELILESPGYPNGYLDNQCDWNFVITGNIRISLLVTFLDFDGETGDNLLIEGMRGTTTVSVYNNDANGVPANGHEEAHVDLFHVQFTPSATRFDRRGFRTRFMYSMRNSVDACSGTETLVLNGAYPSAALHSPRYPRRYPTNSECYYTITSVGGNIALEFIGAFNIQGFQDFVYIYDSSSPTEPKLLRIVSGNDLSQWSEIKTGTSSVQVVFEDNLSTRRVGFFIRASLDDDSLDCNGNGVLSNMCSCSTVNNGPICNFDEANDYEPIPSPTPPTATSSCGSTVQLSYVSSNANVLLYPNSFLDGPPPDANPCVWNINGPEGSHHAIIFQDFNLELDVDELSILYTDGRDANGFLLYSSSATDLPYLRSGGTFDLLGTPIIIDSHSFQIIYSGNTEDFNTYNGPAIEVHLLGVGICSTPCLNGGQCSASCDCDDGFQGEICKQTTPQDYTCLVKNAYVKPHFAYPVQLYAIAGTNTIGSESLNFHVYNFESSYTYKSLPPNAVSEITTFGRILSLPSACDLKSKSSRIEKLACSFDGNDFNEPIEIPAIVNPYSDLIKPVGRFTKTLSVDDAEATFGVEVDDSNQYALRWRFNGQVQQKWNGQSSITISNIKVKDGGIYECFIRGGSEYDVVTYRLIVRGCPDNMYGTDCTQTCPTCQNGGTCSDVYGTCICPPGYAGAVCDELLTGNTISRNGSLTCSGLGISDDRCKYVMSCLPDPAGCMCMSGWTGSSCDIRCPSLTFGIDCERDCHCLNNVKCDLATGACPNGCAEGYSGSNCQ